MNILRVVTLFSGYDSQCMSLDRLHHNFPQFDYELIAWSEIDNYAIQAHNAIYPQYADRNLGDVCKIDWYKVEDFDLLTYSSPCQDFSAAGLQKGGIKGSGTRSSLLWECERAIKAKKPKYLLMENVSALVSKKFIQLFNKWQSTLESYGYINYYKVLNAKDYGVPQNRKRVFMVSVRKDIKDKFYFPQSLKTEIALKDVLERSVDKKYYLSEKLMKRFVKNDTNGVSPVVGNLKDEKSSSFGTRTRVYDIDKCAACLCSTDYKGPKLILTRNINPSRNGMNGNVFNPEGVSPTITTNKGEGPKIIQRSHGYNNGGEHDICPTIGCSSFQENNILNSGFRIRKLTPTECFRLMDVSDKDIDKLLNSGISNSQLYKLAGNSIVVSCLYHIFRKLFIETENDSRQLELF